MDEHIINYDIFYNKKFDYLKFMNYERYSYRIDLYNNNLRRFNNDVNESLSIIDKDMNLKNHLLNIIDIEYFFTKNHIILDLRINKLNIPIPQHCTTLLWDKLIQREKNNDLIYKQIQDIIKEMQIRLNSIS